MFFEVLCDVFLISASFVSITLGALAIRSMLESHRKNKRKEAASRVRSIR